MSANEILNWDKVSFSENSNIQGCSRMWIKICENDLKSKSVYNRFLYKNIWIICMPTCHLLSCVIMASVLSDQSCGRDSLWREQCIAWLRKNHREMFSVFKIFFLVFQQFSPAVQTAILTDIVGPTFFFSLT